MTTLVVIYAHLRTISLEFLLIIGCLVRCDIRRIVFDDLEEAADRYRDETLQNITRGVTFWPCWKP